MRILITGKGFIGHHLIEDLLEAGHEVCAMVRSIPSSLSKNKRKKFIKGDLACLYTVENQVHEFRPEVCIHAAWDGIPDYSDTVCRGNLLVALNVFEMFSRIESCRKVIGLGSCLEYPTNGGACSEDIHVEPNSYFHWAKATIDHYGRILFRDKGKDFLWFRIFYVYGHGQRNGALIPRIIQSLLKNPENSLDIKQPDNENDFIFVDDVVSGIKAGCEQDAPSGAYNLGYGTPVKVRDVVANVAEALGIDTPEIPSNRTQASMRFWADTCKSNEYLQWEAKTSIEDGIKQVISQAKQNDIRSQ